MIYDLIAPLYDRVNGDVDYVKWADFIEDIIKKEHKGAYPELVLDLGCGTGRMTLELAKRGCDMTGVDYSVEMLDIARENAEDAGLSDKMLWLCQDMRDLDLYGTVDGAVCTLDSLNHLSGTSDISQVFRRVRLFVEPGGLFIFDMNTPYKHREVLADRAFVTEEDGVMCTWRTRYVPREKRVDMLLDFFVEEQDGRYERYQDTVSERAYSLGTVKRLLTETGWDIVAVYEAMTTNEPAPDCERWVFVARSNRTEAEARGE